MAQEDSNTARAGSKVDPCYSTVEYFSDPQRHSEDADFKADNFLKVFLRSTRLNNLKVSSIADVGCGSGDIVKRIAESLRISGFNLEKIRGNDVSPHVRNIRHAGVEFIFGGFCESEDFVDVATLFDVFEHVPDTIGFTKAVAERCRVIGFHIPLDYSINVAIRDMFHA